MTLTPTGNVKNMKVVDNDKIIKKVIHSDNMVDTYNVGNKTYNKIKLINISVFDDFIVLNSIKYNVLNVLWKPEAV